MKWFTDLCFCFLAAACLLALLLSLAILGKIAWTFVVLGQPLPT